MAYTIRELRAKIASNDYGAELCLQSAMANIEALEKEVAALLRSDRRSAKNGMRNAMEPNPKRPLKHWSTLPKKRGLYVRDWRGTRVLPESDRRLTMDLWEPLPPGDPMGSGLWYVWPGWNDASHDRLPWREATRAEKATFLRDNPGAKDAL